MWLVKKMKHSELWKPIIGVIAGMIIGYIMYVLVAIILFGWPT
jgi:hypothetical protein